MAKKGGSIVLVGRNEERLNDVRERIKNAGAPKPLIVVADITVDAERIITETINHFGKLDVLINNAGILSRNTVETVKLTEFDRIMNTNVRSVIALTQLAVPHLEKTKGNVLIVSSIAGVRIRPNSFVYSISKSAVNQLTRSAALDLAPKGIRVNAILPGAIRTPIFETGEGITSQQAEVFFESFKKLYPVGRVGEGSDTSAAIEYLISDSASFITGCLLPVEGGALLVGQ